MNQQHKVAIKQLMPELLNDEALNRAAWAEELDSVFVGAGGISVVVGGEHCLVYDSEHRRWYHYQLPAHGQSWVLGRDSARLWGLVDDGRLAKLAMLDLSNGKWMELQNRLNYKSILYAEGETVIAQCGDVLVIDVFRLENDGLRRILSVPLTLDFIPETMTSALLPKENQFILLGRRSLRCALFRLDWNGQSKVIFDVEGDYPLLRFPFFVMFDSESHELIYADLRENSVELRHVDLHLKPEREGNRWIPVDAFAFNDSLIVALGSRYYNNRGAAIIRLKKGEKPEVLYKRKSSEQEEFFDLLFGSRLRLLGRFLTLNGKWIYDLVTQQQMCDLPWSVLLHQAIQHEAEQQRSACITTALTLTTLIQSQESSDSDVFKVLLRPSLYRVAEVANQANYFGVPIFSSWRSSLFVRYETPTVCLLPKGASQLRYLLPEPASGWVEATFDEHGRVWACDKYGRVIAIANPDEEEGRLFVLPHDFSLSSIVRAIAAYDNILAVASSKELAIYRYEDGSLKRPFFWKSNRNKIYKIKPDIDKGGSKSGLWVTTSISNSYVFKHMPLGEKFSAPKEVERIGHPFGILGDWPEQVYFVYGDDRGCALHYTLDPRKGWHKVSLQSVVRGRYDWIVPVSMSSYGDSILTLLDIGSAYLLVRLQTDNVELISAFNREINSTNFMRWNDWLVLYCEQPLVFAQTYADRAMITELPENKGGTLFPLVHKSDLRRAIHTIFSNICTAQDNQ